MKIQMKLLIIWFNDKEVFKSRNNNWLLMVHLRVLLALIIYNYQERMLSDTVHVLYSYNAIIAL